MTHSIPDLLSRDGVCARNFCESFAKVAVKLGERKKGKLRIYVTKVLPTPTSKGLLKNSFDNRVQNQLNHVAEQLSGVPKTAKIAS